MNDPRFIEMDSTTVFALILCAIFLLLQLLLCFKARTQFLKLMPIALLVISTIVFSIWSACIGGWDSLDLLFFAILSVGLFFVCCIGWVIWVLVIAFPRIISFCKERGSKKIYISCTCAFLILIFSIGLFWYYHPTYYRFNDRFIIGNTADEITEKYGAFYVVRRNETGEMFCGVYQIQDNTPDLIMSYDNSLWYEIYFKNGVAVEVRLQEGWYGG